MSDFLPDGVTKLKPAIYKIENPYPNWGWVMLNELAEIVGCPPEKEEELLLLEHVGHFRRRWIGEKNKLVITATGEHKTTSIEYITCNGIMFVPAGWALAIIEEMPRLRKELEEVAMRRSRLRRWESTSSSFN